MHYLPLKLGLHDIIGTLNKSAWNVSFGIAWSGRLSHCVLPIRWCDYEPAVTYGAAIRIRQVKWK